MKAALVPVLLTALAAAPPSSSASQVELVKSGELQSSVQATKDGLAVHPVFRDAASSAVVVRRDASGQVERHASMSDIMVARAGSIRILLGGSIEGGGEVSPGEWRGGRIVGGTTKELKAGDMLWIPAGIPHQMILPKGASFTYIAIKVPSH